MNANTLPCIYLFTLGYVKDLRESMKINNNIDDNNIICKFGLTKDLKRRTAEHEKTYSSIKGCNLYLKYYSYIDPLHLYSAESDIKKFMDTLKLNILYENKEELVTISKDMLKTVEKQYSQISKSYIGHISELLVTIKDLENNIEKQMLNYEKKIQELEYQNQIIKINCENLLLKKELELSKK